MTADRLRQRIMDVVSSNGGHLASSLGAVELSLALAEVFDPLRDRVVWDVGHQAYAWKILTGRDEKFATLRQLDGVAPFPNPAESPADAAVAGHAGVALSIAEGLAAACAGRSANVHVVAVVGDAAIANGVSFEALNNLAASGGKVIVVLNDNEMSISRPVGSLAKLFGRLITNVRYNRVKAAAEKAGHRLRLTFLRGAYHRLESRVKSWFVGNALFEQFGLRYIGPVDGHDLAKLRQALIVAREDKRSVLVHVVTKKGKGYPPAEKNPTAWHGVPPFDVASVAAPGTDAATWSSHFGATLVDLARRDGRIVALTAGMKDGTGLQSFADAFPSRFYDVGIAESHLVAFAAGLAAGGAIPVVAVYSTFLQRAVDQVMHDVCVAKLPVVFCVDRSGVVGADGATHQGLYDFAMLRCLPNLTICEPSDSEDFEDLLHEALARPGPTVIRYPRGACPRDAGGSRAPNALSRRAVCASDCPRVAVWSTGDWFGRACAVARRVRGVAVAARYMKPFDADLLARQRAEGMLIVCLENCAVQGGLGEALGADVKLGWPDVFVPHGAISRLERRFGLDEDSVVCKIEQALKRKGVG